MHGIIMVFFFLIPAIPAVLGNFLVPLMIGAKDLAFPRLNLASWYVYNLGGIFTLWAIVHGGVDTGWTFYTPLSAPPTRTPTSIATGLGHLHQRLLVDPHRPELHRHHPPDARAGPDLVPPAALHLVALRDQPDHGPGHAGDRHHPPARWPSSALFGLGIFDPRLGGDPILFQHLFWFYSHPAVYIMILPAMGVISELIAAFARKRIFGYSFVAFASVGIAVLGFLVWGHHMFVTGQSVYAGDHLLGALACWWRSPRRSRSSTGRPRSTRARSRTETPMLYALGFIGLFTIGGLTGRHARDPGHRRPRARHLLHRGALPLHHGGRHDHGLPGRPALLVAQDHRPDVPEPSSRGWRRCWSSSAST